MYRAKRVDNGEMIEGYHAKQIVGTLEDVVDIIVDAETYFPTEIIPETLEIKIGGHWFKPDEADRLVGHAKWMLASIDYGNAQTGLVLKDSPEVKDLREILAEKE